MTGTGSDLHFGRTVPHSWRKQRQGRGGAWTEAGSLSQGVGKYGRSLGGRVAGLRNLLGGEEDERERLKNVPLVPRLGACLKIKMVASLRGNPAAEAGW